MGILDTATKYEDFKYVIQDVGSVSLGAKYSYEDMLNEELIPFKFKSIIKYYILKEADKSTTLESEFYYMEEGTFLYETYRQLKTKVKVRTQSVKKNIFGKEKVIYKEEILSLKEITGMNLAKKKASGLVIVEIIISKLGLMTFSV